MTPASQQAESLHIVVTLDASESGCRALESAARLAAILGTKLEGIFIEDINLIRLAGLPFLREVRPWSLAEETINTQRMQRELRMLARHAEQMLEQAAGEMRIPWSFQIWRGHAEAASLAQTFAADIISLGRASSLATSRIRTTPRVRAGQSSETVTAISVLFSGSQQAARALTTACHLAKDLGARLTVLLPGNRTKGIKQAARAILESQQQASRLVQLSGTGMQSLVQATAASGAGVVIAEAGYPLLQQAGLDRFLETLSCALLLVR